MSSPESFSIRDLADPSVHIEWHEAIAVVAEVGTWLVSYGRDRLPDLDGSRLHR